MRKNNHNPFVTILICSYNFGHMIERAILSALDQDYPQESYEIIVINDGSTDNTSLVLDKYKERLIIFDQPNSGLPAACNSGIMLSKGELLIRLDADDELFPNSITSFVEAYLKDNKTVMVIADREEYSQNIVSGIKTVSPDNLFEVIAPGILFNLGKLKEVGGYRNFYWEEYDLYLRIKDSGVINYINRPLYKYYKHKNNMTGSFKAREKGWIDLIDEWGIDKLREIGNSTEMENIYSKHFVEEEMYSKRDKELFKKKTNQVETTTNKKVNYLDKSSLEKLFGGKNICILGNAKTLLRWENGEKISDHDIIIRINDFTVEEKYNKHIGNRTDIIFINNHMARHMSAEEIFNLLKRNNSNVLLTKFDGDKLFQKLLNYNFDYTVSVGSIMDKELDETFQHKYLSTGSICIACLLLISQPARLFVSGFDFYLNEDQYYNDERYVIDMNHDKYREIEYWKNNIINNSCVEVDPAIKECLSSPLKPKPDIRIDPVYSRPPIRDKNISIRTLDLRYLDKNNLEINCDNGHHWQIILGNKCRETKVVISTESDVLYVVVPHKSNCIIKTLFQRTTLFSPGLDIVKSADNLYKVSSENPDAAYFNITIDDNILIVIILDWFE